MTHFYQTELIFTVAKGVDPKIAAKIIQEASNPGVIFNVTWEGIEGRNIPVIVQAPNGQADFIKLWKELKERKQTNKDKRLFTNSTMAPPKKE